MRISDWSSDVCSSDLGPRARRGARAAPRLRGSSRIRAALDRRDGAGTMGYPGARDYGGDNPLLRCAALPFGSHPRPCRDLSARRDAVAVAAPVQATAGAGSRGDVRRIARSEEHTSGLQSLMRISYAVFCLKKKKQQKKTKENDSIIRQ